MNWTYESCLPSATFQFRLPALVERVYSAGGGGGGGGPGPTSYLQWKSFLPSMSAPATHRFSCTRATHNSVFHTSTLMFNTPFSPISLLIFHPIPAQDAS